MKNEQNIPTQGNIKFDDETGEILDGGGINFLESIIAGKAIKIFARTPNNKANSIADVVVKDGTVTFHSAKKLLEKVKAKKVITKRLKDMGRYVAKAQVLNSKIQTKPD